MRIYNTKWRVTFTLVAASLSLSGLSFMLFFLHHDLTTPVPAIGFLSLAVFFRLSKSQVVATNEFIKVRMLSFEQTCNRGWIYHIKTFREPRTRRYWTVLSWSKEPGSRNTDWKEIFKLKPKSGMIRATEQSEGYPGL